MATFLGEFVNLAKRSGLPHHIGKVNGNEIESCHVEINNISKKYKENEVVINAIV